MAGDEGLCGECGGPVVERMSTDELDSSYKYRKKCIMCNETFPFHEKCAKFCATNCAIHTISSTKYNAKEWCMSDSEYICKINCMTACFICGKQHKLESDGVSVIKCKSCEKKWCYITDTCKSGLSTFNCINCNPFDDTLFNNHKHQGIRKIPFWSEKGVTLPSNVSHVSRIQWLTKSNCRRKQFKFAAKKPKKDHVDECSCMKKLLEKKEKPGNESYCLSSQCELHAMYMECPKTCSVGAACGNNRIMNGLWKKLLVFNTGKKGLGVKTLEKLKKDEFICEYTGVALSKSLTPSEIMSSNTYIMDYEYSVVLSAKDIGSVCRYVNHSCNPNTYIKKWIVNDEARIGLFALKPINAMDELHYDYQWTTTLKDNNERCHCNYHNCRTWMKKRISKDNFEVRIPFFTTNRTNELTHWTVDISQFEMETKVYHKYINSHKPSFKSMAKELVLSRTIDAWKEISNTCMNFLANKMKYLPEGTKPDKRISSYSGFITKNVSRMKSREMKDLYNTLYELMFIPITKMPGSTLTKDSTTYELPVTIFTNLWLISRVTFGVMRQRVIRRTTLSPADRTKIGNKILKYLECHVNPTAFVLYEELADTLTKNDTATRIMEKLNIHGTSTYIQKETKHIVQQFPKIFEERNGKEKNFINEVLSLSVKLAMTPPNVFNGERNSTHVAYSLSVFTWRCCNDAIGSLWYHKPPNIPDNDKEEDNQSFSSKSCNQKLFIENKNKSCIQFGYENLTRTEWINFHVERLPVSQKNLVI